MFCSRILKESTWPAQWLARLRQSAQFQNEYRTDSRDPELCTAQLRTEFLRKDKEITKSMHSQQHAITFDQSSL